MPALAQDECWMNEDWQRFLAQLLCQLLYYILAPVVVVVSGFF